jgi:hypothetical protein
MKDKIKNGYFFIYWDNKAYIRVGSRCYRLPLQQEDLILYVMFKDIVEKKIKHVWTPNGERVE